MTSIMTDASIIFGSDDDDDLEGMHYIDESQGAGNTILGRGGNDWVFGWGGNDRLFGGTGNDFVSGGDGDDIIAVETNLGNFGNDQISGGSGYDKVVFQTATVTDRFLSSPSVTIRDALRGVSVNLVSTTDVGAVKDFAAHINADGSVSDGSTTLRGHISNGKSSILADIEEFDLTSHDDFFIDSSASHTILGGGGNDFISGGGGADVIDGGDGIDTAMYRLSTAGVSVSLQDHGSGGGGAGGEAQGDTLFDIENVYGSDYDDYLLGDAGSNELRGFDGDDVISAVGGDDRVFGGDGDDTLNGGTGNDLIDGGSGIDTAQFRDWNGTTAAPLVSIRGTIVLGEGDAEGTATLTTNAYNFTTQQIVTTVIETDALKAIENVEGSKFTDVITGNSAANVLNGLDGNDTLDGGRGDDTLIGGNGVDTAAFAAGAEGGILSVDASLARGTAIVDRIFVVDGFKIATTETDTLSGIENLTGAAGDDHLTGDGGANVLRGEGGDDRLVGRGGADTLTGGDGHDVLIGGGAGDTLSGGALRDFLNGGTGDDTLSGGSGSDVFVFNGRNAGHDTITDFEDGYDVIRFDTGLVHRFHDLDITGNGSDHVTVVYGDQSIDIFGASPITLTASDFDII
jgi:Ca2+-binding RTX toxin-like protein